MVKLELKANPHGQYYFPSEIRKELGRNLEFIGDFKVGVIFPKGMRLEDVLKSLEVIRLDLKHRIEFASKKKRGG